MSISRRSLGEPFDRLRATLERQEQIDDKAMQAREELLGAALAVIREGIADRSPGPHDDSESELHEEQLIAAARSYVAATEARKPLFTHDWAEPVKLIARVEWDRLLHPPLSVSALSMALNRVASAREEREHQRKANSLRLYGHTGAWVDPHPLTLGEIVEVAARAVEGFYRSDT